MIFRIIEFPPLVNHYRFIIHQIVEEEFSTLCTFSLGADENRRNIVCPKKLLITVVKERRCYDDAVCELGRSLIKVDPERNKHRFMAAEQSAKVVKRPNRKPDRQLYVPRSLRSEETAAAVSTTCSVGSGDGVIKQNIDLSSSELVSATPKDLAVSTQKSATSKRPRPVPMGVYVPPALRRSASNNEGDFDSKFCVSDCNMEPNVECDNGKATSNNIIISTEACRDLEAGKDSSRSCREVYVAPALRNRATSLESQPSSSADNSPVDTDINFNNCRDNTPVVSDEKAALYDVRKNDFSKSVEDDLLKVSKEMASTSDDDPKKGEMRNVQEEGGGTWEEMFDENGGATDPQAMKEIVVALGKVNVVRPKIDYLNFQMKQLEVDDDEFGHVIEVFDFPAEYDTEALCRPLRTTLGPSISFNVQWVDDTHALLVFDTISSARRALQSGVSRCLQLRPISLASSQSKLKAKRCCEFLRPHKPRPETSAALARRLVTGALGVKLHDEQRSLEMKERQRLKEAKAERHRAKEQQREIWES